MQNAKSSVVQKQILFLNSMEALEVSYFLHMTIVQPWHHSIAHPAILHFVAQDRAKKAAKMRGRTQREDKTEPQEGHRKDTGRDTADTGMDNRDDTGEKERERERERERMKEHRNDARRTGGTQEMKNRKSTGRGAKA